MSENLLSISEAAKLMGVCENTLRDWDIEGKFKSLRTLGGHRRYTLEQIRKYLELHPPEAPPSTLFPQTQPTNFPHESLMVKWQKDLEDVKGDYERRFLAILLENTATYRTYHKDDLFSTDQMIWLTKQTWLRCRFRKMIVVQPLQQPCGLAFYLNATCDGLTVESEAVAAKVYKYDCKFFIKAKFDDVKDLYADALAYELETMILEHLPRMTVDKVKTALSYCDYLIGPASLIEELKDPISNVDFYAHHRMMDKETFEDIAFAGQYPKSLLTTPVFMPYHLLLVHPLTSPMTAGGSFRAGWFDLKKSSCTNDNN